MFSAAYKAGVNARHALRHSEGPESTEHSHPYEVEWICGTENLDASGYAIDLSLLEGILKEELAKIDDRFLNDLEFFREREPSLENFAVFLFTRLSGRLASSRTGVRPVRMEVRIWESREAWASFEGRP